MTVGIFLELTDIIATPIMIIGSGNIETNYADIVLYEADSFVRDDLRVIPDDVLHEIVAGFNLEENGNFIIYVD